LDVLNKIAVSVRAIEAGRRIGRDLADADPEFMSPLRFTGFIKKIFEPLNNVKVTVILNSTELEKEYPLLSAVARASQQVPHHQPRVIRLEYTGEGYFQFL
jgi:leucyl aminopeptidase